MPFHLFSDGNIWFFGIKEKEDVFLPKKTNETSLIEESLPIEKYDYYL